jgi:dipeptidyl aminopeptidase/acylaminoacyl peptidase
MASTGAIQPSPETSAVSSTEVGLASTTPTDYLPRPTSTRTPLPTASPTATLTPAAILSPTPDPYAGLTIEDLATRGYGGGALQIKEAMDENSYFARYLITYPSDGLQIYGFMDIPKGGGPFPVIIASHGYIDPGVYNTLDYTTGYADALARAGYLVIHPNLRGYPPSDDGPNLFRVGMAVDVLNLIAMVKEQGGTAGALTQADPNRIGLWGHSMGGGITTRVMVVSPDVRAVLLYGPMSGDEWKNYERILNYFSNGTRGMEELSAPLEAFKRISPIYYLDRVQAAVSVHHGENDSEVPIEWSLDLCDRLKSLGKSVECFTYPGQGHTFTGDGEQLFIQRMIDFFDRELKNESKSFVKIHGLNIFSINQEAT